jgi:hypothetical protein
MDVTENKIEKMKAQIVILEHEILRLKSRLNMPTSPGFNTSINAVCATQKEYFREKLAKSFRRRKTPVPKHHFGPWPDWYCGEGDLWGYGEENMVKVREAAKVITDERP